jgi:hypothetical protein
MIDVVRTQSDKRLSQVPVMPVLLSRLRSLQLRRESLATQVGRASDAVGSGRAGARVEVVGVAAKRFRRRSGRTTMTTVVGVVGDGSDGDE